MRFISAYVFRLVIYPVMQIHNQIVILPETLDF